MRIHLIAYLFAVFLMAISLIARPAQADSKPATQKGDWNIQMMKDSKGAFGYCLMRAPYNNDLTLAIALSPKQEVNIGIQVPKADFAPEERHPLRVEIDSIYKNDRLAVAVEKELLLAPMGADKTIYKALAKGKVLKLTGPEDTARFTLTNSGKAMAALKQCVDIGTGKVKPSTMPEQTDKADSKKDKKQAQGKGGFPPGLLQLLKKSGLNDLQLIEIKDPAKAPVDFAWRTNGVFGGMRERPVPKDITLEKMGSLIEGGYKKKCDGMFNASFAPIEDLKVIKLRTADITCQMKDRVAYVAILIYLTDTNLFTMFMHEATAEGKDAANKARDSIAATIKQLAKQ